MHEWREVFAEKLRDQGVDAEATPRRSRGAVRKAERNVIRHIERGDKTHQPRTSRVKAAKIKEAADELSAEVKEASRQPRPWEARIKATQATIRGAWLAAANALETDASTPKLFNFKAQHNERPDYPNISAKRARSGQRSAAVYQSNLAKAGTHAAPRTIAGMRNLSCLDMVHHERGAKVLLQPNAPDRMGRHRTASDAMRRAGIGDSGTFRSKEGLTSDDPAIQDAKAFADRIKRFVAAMPTIGTERHEIKRALLARFTRQREQSQVEPIDAPDRSTPGAVVTKMKDVER